MNRFRNISLMLAACENCEDRKVFDALCCIELTIPESEQAIERIRGNPRLQDKAFLTEVARTRARLV